MEPRQTPQTQRCVRHSLNPLAREHTRVHVQVLDALSQLAQQVDALQQHPVLSPAASASPALLIPLAATPITDIATPLPLDYQQPLHVSPLLKSMIHRARELAHKLQSCCQ